MSPEPAAKRRRSLIVLAVVAGVATLGVVAGARVIAARKLSGVPALPARPPLRIATPSGPPRHAPPPVPTIAGGELPASATAEQRAYAAAMDKVAGYRGDRGVLDDAEVGLKAMLAANPSSAMASAGLARVAFVRSQRRHDEYDAPALDGALALADQAIARDPTLPDGFIVRGWVLRARKDGPGAHAALEAALKLAPQSPRALLLQADLALSDGDPDGADRTLRDLLSRPLPRAAATSALAALASLYEHVSDLAGCDAVHRRAIETEPDSAWVKSDYAAFLVREGQLDAAVAMAQASLAMARTPTGERALAEAHCARGAAALWERSDLPGASAEFHEAARADARDACAPYGLGACDQYEAVTTRDPSKLPSARRAYVRAAALDSRSDLARKALDALGQ